MKEPMKKPMEMGQGLSGLEVSEIGLERAESEWGVETKFTVDNAASIEEVIEGKNRDLEERVKDSKGRILVMDSEEIIRERPRDFLTSIGYEVETARDGNEPIDLYNSKQHQKQRNSK